MYIKKGKKYPPIKQQLQEIKDFMEEKDGKLHLTDAQVKKIKDYITETVSNNFVWNESFGDIIDIWESKLSKDSFIAKYYTKLITDFGYDTSKYIIEVPKSILKKLNNYENK